MIGLFFLNVQSKTILLVSKVNVRKANLIVPKEPIQITVAEKLIIKHICTRNEYEINFDQFCNRFGKLMWRSECLECFYMSPIIG